MQPVAGKDGKHARNTSSVRYGKTSAATNAKNVSQSFKNRPYSNSYMVRPQSQGTDQLHASQQPQQSIMSATVQRRTVARKTIKSPPQNTVKVTHVEQRTVPTVARSYQRRAVNAKNPASTLSEKKASLASKMTGVSRNAKEKGASKP